MKKITTMDTLKAYIFTLLMPFMLIPIMALSELEKRYSYSYKIPSYKMAFICCIILIGVLVCYKKYTNKYLTKLNKKDKVLGLSVIFNFILYIFSGLVISITLVIMGLSFVCWPLYLIFLILYAICWFILLVRTIKIIWKTEYAGVIIGLGIPLLILILDYVFEFK